MNKTTADSTAENVPVILSQTRIVPQRKIDGMFIKQHRIGARQRLLRTTMVPVTRKSVIDKRNLAPASPRQLQKSPPMATAWRVWDQ
jgi:hypothetical protein